MEGKGEVRYTKSLAKAIKKMAEAGNLEAVAVIQGRHPKYKIRISPLGQPYLQEIKTHDTSLEKKMEKILNELGYKEWRDCLKQYPILGYLLDFAFPRLKLDIEVDGTYWHKQRRDKDRLRDNALKRMGWNILRFNEHDLKDESEVKRKLALYLDQRQL